MTKISISTPKRGFHVGSAAVVDAETEAARGLAFRVVEVVAEVEADVDARAIPMVLLISAAGLVPVVGGRVTGVWAAGVLLLLLLPPAPTLDLLEAMANGEQLSRQRSSQVKRKC